MAYTPAVEVQTHIELSYFWYCPGKQMGMDWYVSRVWVAIANDWDIILDGPRLPIISDSEIEYLALPYPNRVRANVMLEVEDIELISFSSIDADCISVFVSNHWLSPFRYNPSNSRPSVGVSKLDFIIHCSNGDTFLTWVQRHSTNSKVNIATVTGLRSHKNKANN